MSERLNALTRRQLRGKEDWSRLAGSPYIRAYDLAFETYKANVESQRAADRARAELFILAASVATGSILMAAFAATSLRVLAGRALLNTVCNNNLNRTFNAMHAAASNKAFMFALGKALDEARSRAGTVVQEAVNGVTRSGATISSPNSIVQLTHINDWLGYQFSCGNAAGEAVDGNPRLSAAEKDAQFDRLEAAPLCNPPTATINEALLSKKIELCMYMNSIMNSDFLVTMPAYHQGGFDGGEGRSANAGAALAAHLRRTRQPIEASPRDSDYPRPAGMQAPNGSGMVARYQTIEYDRLGSGLRARVDSLCREIFGRQFYERQRDRNSNTRDIRVAESVLYQLADATRPGSVSDSRS